MKIHIQIDEITTTHIRGFRDHMMAAGHSAATINLRLETLVTAFNEAKRLGLIDVNPANGVKVRQVKSEGQGKDSRRPFRRSEMLRIIDISEVEIYGRDSHQPEPWKQKRGRYHDENWRGKSDER